MEEDRISGILIHKPWFEAIQFERGLAQYDVDLVFKEVRTYSDQDKLKFIENVWKPGELFDFQRQLNIRIKLSFCVELTAEKIPLASML